MAHPSAQPSGIENRGAGAPAASVIIPAYNAATFIGVALDSVLAQTFTDCEIIVVNDGSPDTPELERALEPYRERIVYLSQENRGAAGARNTALGKAQGAFVAFLDADDCWLPNYLSEQLAFIESGEGYDLVYANALLAGNTPHAGRTFMEEAPSDGEVTLESLLALRCNVITSGTVARRQAIMDANLFDEELDVSEDFDLWTRLAQRGARMSYQRQVLLRYTYRSNSLSFDTIKQHEAALHALGKIERRGGLNSREQAALAATMTKLESLLNTERGKRHLVRGDFAAAAEALNDAARHGRNWKLQLALLSLRAAPRLLRRAYLARSSSLDAMTAARN